MEPALPRGIRNNNPGNIDRNPGVNWQGMSRDQSSDSRFIVFDDAVWGIRAIGRVLRSYQRQGFNTVRKIIDRWAPPKENKTEIYIRFVADKLGVSDGEVIDVTDMEIAVPLARAIIWKECGKQPSGDEWFTEDEIRDGLSRA
jgi:hypothetical protein